MGSRYCFEIADGPAMYYWFAYFDTHDHLADCLFDHEHVSVTVEDEFAGDDDPYRIVLCRIARKDRERFLNAVDLLPSLMTYVGKTDYEAFCRAFLQDAYRFLSEQKSTGSGSRLQ